VENDKFTPEDLEYGEKTENHGKCETHTIGREICREILKTVKRKKCTL
jgi:hypothetical protein